MNRRDKSRKSKGEEGVPVSLVLQGRAGLKPSGPWTEFEEDVRSALGGESDTRASPFVAGSMASIILSFEFAKLRRDVAATMRIAPPLQRLDDRDIISYPWPKPVWIAERIVCLVIAVECIRLFDGRPALFPTVGPLVQAAQCVSALRAAQRPGGLFFEAVLTERGGLGARRR
jgi:hypothetical protein